MEQISKTFSYIVSCDRGLNSFAKHEEHKRMKNFWGSDLERKKETQLIIKCKN